MKGCGGGGGREGGGRGGLAAVELVAGLVAIESKSNMFVSATTVAGVISGEPRCCWVEEGLKTLSEEEAGRIPGVVVSLTKAVVSLVLAVVLALEPFVRGGSVTVNVSGTGWAGGEEEEE